MRIFILLLGLFVISGCAGLTAATVECNAGELNYCAAQIAAEERLNAWIDQSGSATCVDLVHTCAFSQCAFSGCQVDAEAGDFEVLRLPDGDFLR